MCFHLYFSGDESILIFVHSSRAIVYNTCTWVKWKIILLNKEVLRRIIKC